MEHSHPFDDFIPQNTKSKALRFDEQEQRHRRIMAKLKDSIFTTLEASNPSRPINRELKSRIAKQMHEFFPHFGTPTHPPYALMIRMAIMELNEECGSKKESISGFIEKNYEGLPLGHASFLSHHLGMLCGTGEIVCRNDGQYMISVDQVGAQEECCVERQGNEMVNEWNKTRGKQHWCKVGKKAAEARDQQVEGPSALSYDEGQSNSQYEHIEVRRPKNLEELPFEASDKHAVACVQRNQIVGFGQNIPEMEQCMELVKKNTEFQKQVMGNSHSLMGVEEKKDDLELEQQQQARILCTGRASDVKVIRGRKLLQEHEDRFIRVENRPQEHHDEGESKLLRLCCINREDPIGKLCFSLGDTSLTTLKELPKQSVKQDQEQTRNIWEERKFIIICGLQAQRRSEPKIYGQHRAPNSHPENGQQRISHDTTMGVLLSSDYQQDIEQQDPLQLESQDRGRPYEIEGNGNDHGDLRVYVRRRCRA